VEGKANAAIYIIDYRLGFPSGGSPLFLFGVSSNDKAKLATLIIRHWRSQGLPFTSFVVFQDLTKIGPANVARLNNVGDASISPLNAISEFRRKPERLYGSPDASAVASA
jgi:hypothetical protein